MIERHISSIVKKNKSFPCEVNYKHALSEEAFLLQLSKHDLGILYEYTQNRWADIINHAEKLAWLKRAFPYPKEFTEGYELFYWLNVNPETYKCAKLVTRIEKLQSSVKLTTVRRPKKTLAKSERSNKEVSYRSATSFIVKVQKLSRFVSNRKANGKKKEINYVNVWQGCLKNFTIFVTRYHVLKVHLALQKQDPEYKYYFGDYARKMKSLFNYFVNVIKSEFESSYTGVDSEQVEVFKYIFDLRARFISMINDYEEWFRKNKEKINMFESSLNPYALVYSLMNQTRNIILLYYPYTLLTVTAKEYILSKSNPVLPVKLLKQVADETLDKPGHPKALMHSEKEDNLILKKQRKTNPSTVKKYKDIVESVDYFRNFEGMTYADAMRRTAERTGNSLSTIERAVGLKR